MIPDYNEDSIKIFLGDCLEVMPQLKAYSFDAVIADLPYGTTSCSWDSPLPLDKIWMQYDRLVKGTGNIILFGSQPFSSRLIQAGGFNLFKYEIIWEKTRPTGFVHAKNKPLKYHENILVFSKGVATHKSQSSRRMTYNPQMTASYKKRGKRVFRTDPRGVMFGGHASGRSFKEFEVEYSEYYPRSIITFANPNHNTVHNTQKPLALMQYLVRTFTNPGDTILDNVCGSGSTLVAARNEGRKAVGIEISHHYYKTAVDRLRQKNFYSV